MKIKDDWTFIQDGIKARKTKDGYTSVLLHYSADPNDRGTEVRQRGLEDQDYRREHELDFTAVSGKPVFGDYSAKSHESIKTFYQKEILLLRSWDFGYHRPSVVYSQAHGDGSWWPVGELIGKDTSLSAFIEGEVRPYEATRFPEAKFLDSADPAGKQVSDKSENSSFLILANYGIYPQAAPSAIKEGLALIREKLRHTEIHNRTEEGPKGLLINPHLTPLLAEGFRGAYCYAKSDPGKPEKELPEKDGFYEHLFDALRYTAVNHFYLLVLEERKEPELTLPQKILKGKRTQKEQNLKWL